MLFPVETTLGNRILPPPPYSFCCRVHLWETEGTKPPQLIFESLHDSSGRWREVKMISPTLGRRTFSSTLGRAAPSPFPRLFACCRGHLARGSQLPASAVRGLIARTREGTKWDGLQKPHARGRRILVADFGWVDGVGGGFVCLFVVDRGWEGSIPRKPVTRLVRWLVRQRDGDDGRCCICAAGLICRVRWSAAQALG